MAFPPPPLTRPPICRGLGAYTVVFSSRSFFLFLREAFVFLGYALGPPLNSGNQGALYSDPLSPFTFHLPCPSVPLTQSTMPANQVFHN